MRCRPSVTRFVAVALLSMSAAACSAKDILASALEHENFVTTSITEVNGSGIEGVSDGSFTDGDAQVGLTGYIRPVVVGQSFVGHLHQGTCAAIGTVVQTLPAMVGRVPVLGSNNAPIDFETLVSRVVGGHVLDFHTMINGVDTRIACGPISSRQA